MRCTATNPVLTSGLGNGANGLNNKDESLWEREMSIATLKANPALSVPVGDIPLDKIDVSNPDLFVNDTVGD